MVGAACKNKQKNSENASDSLQIPTNIFLDRSISVLEALAEYLKDTQGMNYADIGRATNRDERNIWTAYHRAKEKRANTKPTDEATKKFPLHIVQDRTLPITESIVRYMRNNGVTNAELSLLLNRSRKTISTIYRRAIAR